MDDHNDHITANGVNAAVQNAYEEVKPGMDSFIRGRHPRGFRARDTCYAVVNSMGSSTVKYLSEYVANHVDEIRRSDILRMYRRFTWISAFIASISGGIGYLIGGL